MTTLDQRVSALESRIDATFAVDTRLRSLETDVKALKTPARERLRDWLAALGPFASSLALLLVGYWINDSVKAALEREQLDLDYVKDMRDVIKDFNESTAQPEADANAIALALYGKHSILPLIAALDRGDVANLAAEKGLLLVGGTDPLSACAQFATVINNVSQRYSWESHKTVIRVMGHSSCVRNTHDIMAYLERLKQKGTDPTDLKQFAERYSDPLTFDLESAAGLRGEAEAALKLLQPTENP
jgi:hypothetical protein